MIMNWYKDAPMAYIVQDTNMLLYRHKSSAENVDNAWRGANKIN